MAAYYWLNSYYGQTEINESITGTDLNIYIFFLLLYNPMFKI